MDHEAREHFDRIADQMRDELLREIDKIEKRKWDKIRDKMLKWLAANGRLPKRDQPNKKRKPQ